MAKKVIREERELMIIRRLDQLDKENAVLKAELEKLKEDNQALVGKVTALRIGLIELADSDDRIRNRFEDNTTVILSRLEIAYYWLLGLSLGLLITWLWR